MNNCSDCLRDSFFAPKYRLVVKQACVWQQEREDAHELHVSLLFFSPCCYFTPSSRENRVQQFQDGGIQRSLISRVPIVTPVFQKLNFKLTLLEKIREIQNDFCSSISPKVTNIRCPYFGFPKIS